MRSLPALIATGASLLTPLVSCSIHAPALLDQIPVVENPSFTAAHAAAFLADEDLVLGVVVDEEARAFPLKILDQFEVVNDRIGRFPIVVTW